jgi:hypothetical protein
MVCTQEGTPAMEIYLPQSIVFGKKPLAQALPQPVIGYYAPASRRRAQERA